MFLFAPNADIGLNAVKFMLSTSYVTIVVLLIFVKCPNNFTSNRSYFYLTLASEKGLIRIFKFQLWNFFRWFSDGLTIFITVIEPFQSNKYQIKMREI